MKKQNSPNITFVSEYTKTPYDECKAEMDYIREEFGLIYREYVSGKLYTYKTFQQKHKAIKNLLAQEKRYLEEICNDTGWSYDSVEERAKYVKNKFGQPYANFCRLRLFTCTDEQIQQTLDSWKNKSNQLLNIVVQKSGMSTETAKKHIKRMTTVFGITESYYVCFRAWQLSDDEMRSYARHGLSRQLWNKYNDKNAIRILADKVKFNIEFDKYIGRHYWINRDSSLNEFLSFIDGLEKIFIKPVEAGGGNGAQIINVNEYENKENLYNTFISRERVLVEECISQHHEISEFAPYCVNTVRVVVLKDTNGIHILGAVMKFAVDKIVDNFEQGGLLATVDIETGTIITDAVDCYGNEHSHHPISKKRINGFVIPNWEHVLQISKEAINVVEGINYVGWDIAICEDKAVIVEGNSMPDLSMNQAPYAPMKKGIKDIFAKYL